MGTGDARSDARATSLTKAMRSPVIGGSFWTLMGRATSLVAGIALAAFATRLLPQREAGAFLLILSLTAAGSLVGQFGMHRSVIRHAAPLVGRKNHDGARLVLVLCTCIAIAGSLIISSVAVLPATGDRMADALHLPVVAGLMPLVALMTFLRSMNFYAAEVARTFKAYSVAGFVGGADWNAILILCLTALAVTSADAGLIRITLFASLAMVPGIVLVMLTLRTRIGGLLPPRPLGDWRLAGGEILRTGRSVLLLTLGTLAMMHADVWIVSTHLDLDDTAIYAVGLRLATLVGTPLFIVNSVVPPLAAELFAHDREEEYEIVARALTTLVAIPGVLLFVAYLVAGEEILGLIFGAPYEHAKGPVAVLAFGQTVSLLLGSSGVTLIMAGHEKAVMRSTISMALVMVLGALLLVEPFGLMGVAWSTTVALILNNVIMWGYLRARLGVSTHIKPRLSKDEFVRAISLSRT